MNRDYVALAGILGSIALLYATAHVLFFLPLFFSAMYGGYRYAPRLIQPTEV